MFGFAAIRERAGRTVVESETERMFQIAFARLYKQIKKIRIFGSPPGLHGIKMVRGKWMGYINATCLCVYIFKRAEVY